MLFMATFPGWIASGRKTQTRRLFHAGDALSNDGLRVVTAKGQSRWKVGCEYAVQVKRGGKGLWVDTRNGTVYTHEQRIELPDMVRVREPQQTLKSKEEGVRAMAAALFGSSVRVASGIEGDYIVPFHVDMPKPSMYIRQLRIQVTALKLEDVRTISMADARAEGFNDINDFLNTWIKLNDHKVKPLSWSGGNVKHWKYGRQTYTSRPGDDERYIRQDFGNFLNTRPAELYKAWAISFKVV